MAKITTRLSDKEIKAAKPRNKEYILSDGGGLRIRIKPNGSKLWLFNYTHPKKRKRTNLGLGKYPDLSLANARRIALDSKALIAQGIDPQENKKRQQQEHEAIQQNTFLKVSKEWFAIKQDDITANHATDIWRSLELHIFPNLNNTPVTAITAPKVIEILKPIEARGNLETVKRLIQRLNEIMDFATNYGLVTANPLTGIKSAFKKPKKANIVPLQPNELPELINAIDNASIKHTTRFLIEWQLHTMTRPSEAAGTRWDEIDLEAKVWTIPPARMKKRRKHRIPLTEQTIALLEKMKPISGSREFVFPSDRDPLKPCNNQTVNMALKRMGFEGWLVSHGLRSLASTTLNEQSFEADLIEAALAHVDSNQVRSAYNRTDYLERRIPMMEWWSNHIVTARKSIQ
ncbi:integrase domain-containing protein [Photobacterium leiognathi]|uniref:integrase domain-containing protein n=1 Tax=Photobacterium leiognathi TaxID=553611 RepID=UPI002733500C|nr:integrase domain-containing protein [Photobacterium leiognathi]